MRTVKPRRGRPKADPNIQRNKIFIATMEILLQSGYQKATTLSIAKASGISKNTLYSHFRSKEVLFTALIKNRMTAVNDFLAAAIEDTSLDLEEVLKHFSRLVLGQLTSEISVAMNRACMTAASSQGLALSRTYFKYGHEPIREKLKAILERARTNGIITFDDIDEVYQTLFGLIYGDLHMRRLLGIASMPDKKQIEDKAEKAIEKFMKLFTP